MVMGQGSGKRQSFECHNSRFPSHHDNQAIDKIWWIGPELLGVSRRSFRTCQEEREGLVVYKGEVR